MAYLLDRVAGLRGIHRQRPSRDEFQGINTESLQAKYLAGWWPTWEPHAAQPAPQAMDYGPNGMHMYPSALTLHAPDPQMGTAWAGGLNPATRAGVYSGYAQARPYASGVANRMDPVDFGALPGFTGSATPHMSTAWIKTSTPATQFTGGSPLDAYIYTFDRNDGFGYPGHNLGLITQIFNGNNTPIAAAAATMYDNDTAGHVPFGVQSLQVVNDGLWHLICGIYIPTPDGATSNYGTATQYIAVDGQVGFIGGVDTDSTTGTQSFGRSTRQSNLGSPNDSTRAALSPVYQIMGADDDGVSSPFPGSISDHRLYDFSPLVGLTGGLSIVQYALQLAAHMYAPDTRWDLYDAPRSRVRTFLPAVGYTLTADPGTFDETGNAANLLAGRKMVAAAGTLTETGVAASLETGRRLVAGAGTFAGAGLAAALNHGYLVAASTGAFAESGQAAGFLITHRLVAGAGTFSESGLAAGLAPGRRLAASAGTFAETGIAASTRVGHKLTASAGAFAEVGNAAGLRASRVLASSAGSFLESGLAAAPGVGRKLTTAAGAFAETGVAAGLRTSRVLASAAGTFVEVGVAAAPGVGHRLAASAASFALTGSVAGFSYGTVGHYTFAAAAGAFSETGLAATLKDGRRLTAGAGTFSEAGNAASLFVARKVAAAAGAFSETGQAAGLLATHRLIAGAGTFSESGLAASTLATRRLVAASGTFAEAGNAASLARTAAGHFTVIASAGTFAGAGAASTLVRSRRLAASTGAFAEAGLAASLAYGRTVPAGAGSFAVAGHAAGMTHGGGSALSPARWIFGSPIFGASGVIHTGVFD